MGIWLKLQLRRLEFLLQQLWLLQQLLQPLLQLPELLLFAAGLSVWLRLFNDVQWLLGLLLSNSNDKRHQQAEFDCSNASGS